MGNEAKAEKPVHSAALVEDLTAQKTAALRVELMNNADIALATVVHSLLLNIAYPHFPDLSCLEIRLVSEHIERVIKNPDENKAIIELRSITENWGEKIPGNPSDLWEWCLEQPREQLLELLAYAAGHSVNAIKRPHNLRKNSCEHADRLAVALNIDMAKWFTPTADNYFSRIGRQTIQATVAEVRGTDFADGISKMKKSEAAVYAESQLFDTGWLPEPVRIFPLEKEAM